jgi:NDP-sugar pyrophosphorylase family protein
MSSKLDFDAVILTGGRGSRLYPLTQGFPKALLPIGNKPLLHFILDEMFNAGARKVTILINDGTSSLIPEHMNSVTCDQKVRWKDMPIEFIYQINTSNPIDCLLQYPNPVRSTVFSHCDEIIPSEILESLVRESHERESLGLAIFNSLGRRGLGKVNFSGQKFAAKEGVSSFSHVSGRYVFPAKIWSEWKSIARSEAFSSILESCISFGKNGGKIIGMEFDTGYYDFGTLELYRKNVLEIMNCS